MGTRDASDDRTRGLRTSRAGKPCMPGGKHSPHTTTPPLRTIFLPSFQTLLAGETRSSCKSQPSPLDAAQSPGPYRIPSAFFGEFDLPKPLLSTLLQTSFVSYCNLPCPNENFTHEAVVPHAYFPSTLIHEILAYGPCTPEKIP